MLARFSRSAFICRAIDSTRSRGGWMSLISMRLTLTPHGMGGLVDGDQQLGIDLVALGQRLVQVHRADHGADVGHHQVEDGDLQGGDFVRGLGRIQHLEDRPRRRPSPPRCPW
jgi:hypothetical protein